ncbi:hypothetical protein A4A49_04041 [Nicotiana attenuata]|uniref:Uncharacterized protein n=1 Tax=Nicotiana attenuata TaxID=49451 RepID=A0A314L170_NICAT|nr:hypothetical protein A4A49_04041 [Nicotiana attenuata]
MNAVRCWTFLTFVRICECLDNYKFVATLPFISLLKIIEYFLIHLYHFFPCVTCTMEPQRVSSRDLSEHGVISSHIVFLRAPDSEKTSETLGDAYGVFISFSLTFNLFTLLV